MKPIKFYLLTCLLSIFILTGISSHAQAPARKAHPKKAAVANKKVANKIHSRKAIRRTAIVIKNAQQKVKMNKNYTGDLSKAFAHQRFARKLHMRGLYGKAIHHTRVARIYARKAIKANKGVDISEANFTAEEEELMKDSPSEQELMDELVREEAKPVINDEVYINETSDIDLNEND